MKPNLSSFETLFQSGENFSITEEQYKEAAGLNLPKQPYLQKKSALARMAKEYGYNLQVINVVVYLEKKKD